VGFILFIPILIRGISRYARHEYVVPLCNIVLSAFGMPDHDENPFNERDF
jgi:hypothetical protein